MSHRPNLVIFMPDQLRADCVGAFGNPVVRTPHLDALAARGTRFTNAFAQHSVCSPSRASILTGWYPHVRGHRTLTNLLQPDEPNLLRTLRGAGYHVTWVGARGDTFAPGVTELSCDEYGMAEPAGHRQQGQPFPDDAAARAFFRGRREAPDDGVVLDSDEVNVRAAERWLSAPPDGPWVLFVPLQFPHCPFEVEEPWFSLHRREDLPAAAHFVSGHEPRFHAAIRERYGLDRLDADRWREITATYYGMVARIDDQLGRVVSAVEAAGLWERTVTLFFTDHGEYLGDYGLVEKWPSGLSDCLVHEPLVVAGGGLPEGGTVEAMVEMVDVLPTVLELAGVEAEHTHFGRSLVPLLHDPGRPHREHAFSEGGFTVSEEPLLERSGFPYDLKAGLQHEDPTLVGKAVAVRSREWTYVWRLYEDAELYSREADPHEQTNLAHDPQYATVVAALRAALLEWLVATGDVIPWQADPRWPDVVLPAAGRRADPPAGDLPDEPGRARPRATAGSAPSSR